MNWLDRLKERFGEKEVIHHSTSQNVEWLTMLSEFVEIAHPSVILEIGTYQGVTAALMAQMVERVITIDIREQPLAREIWEYLGLTNIDYQVLHPKTKAELIPTLDFDFVFIDGDHNHPEVDFYLTSNRAKHILFHDYFHDKRFPRVNRLVDGLQGVTIREPFAFWEAS